MPEPPLVVTAEPDGLTSVLKKAFAILDAFDHQHPVLPVSSVMRRTGLPKSTTYRVIGALMEIGAVERHSGGYRLGRRMLSVGASPAERSMRDVALPHLRALHRRWESTVHMAVLDGQMVLFLEKLCAPNTISTPVIVGGRLPATSTALGKILLAQDCAPASAVRKSQAPYRRPGCEVGHLREIAYDRGHLRVDLSCVAAPVSANGVVLAAISFAYPSSEGDAAYLVGPLRETARTIGRELAGLPAATFRSMLAGL
ncbi:IclR family transcriptional regulator [Antrihabitans stalactiti]|uniref:IclR family transcriptional regulator n=1 Tax=Antrihabitans stalactiti TaxID=2584121 RepID=A0A848K653_9NOCA|nr:IclR family transcriptional regulator [Antrihabitans stalactiti]NMN93879.1 IclR family transcriptional regulator [Antrihabitans stalactiti]